MLSRKPLSRDRLATKVGHYIHCSAASRTARPTNEALPTEKSQPSAPLEFASIYQHAHFQFLGMFKHLLPWPCTTPSRLPPKYPHS